MVVTYRIVYKTNPVKKETEVGYRRITSYNVCYTKLLRGHGYCRHFCKCRCFEVRPGNYRIEF